MIRVIFILCFLLTVSLNISCVDNKQPKIIENGDRNHLQPCIDTVINFRYKKEGYMGFNRLCNTYSERMLIYALDHIGRKENINKLILPFDIDYPLYDKYIDSILIYKPDLLDNLFDTVYLDNHRDLIIKYTNNWCFIYSILSISYSINSPIYLEEILYTDSLSRDVVKSFLNTPEQDWGSLSSSQLSELPFRLCDKFYRKGEKDLLIFYDSFFKTMTQLIEDSD